VSEATCRVDPDVVLFRGPLHVVTYMGWRVKLLTERDPVGDPVRLAYVERDLRETQDAMDRVYATGRAEDVVNRYGHVHLTALYEQGQVVGVGAVHTYGAPAHPGRRRMASVG
jgi:hypothetical protein